MFTLQNLSNTILSVGGVVIKPSGTVSVASVNQPMIDAQTKGLISITPAVVTTITGLTDSSTGTSGGNTVGAVTDTTTAANGIATVTAKVNDVVAQVNALSTRTATL